ncbi:MAG: N,N-dimethylformamidase beta subunit family domain-containing protein, partial [Actinomycetes bacterium]
MRTRQVLRDQRRRALTAAVTGIATVAALIVMVPMAQVAQAAPCDAPITNPVLCENTKPGNPASEWDVSGAGSSNIQGFATDISVNLGQTVHFKISTPATAYRLDIYRMGYYAGNGARKIATVTPSATLPQSQPQCLSNSSTGLNDCGNWAESASWAVPPTAVSGIYFAKLVRTDATAGSSHIFFVVRDDSSHSNLVMQTSDTTWQAYNTYGGNSLYVGNPDGRAYKVSYNRPITTRDTSPEDFVFNAEYPMVRFLERNGYDVSYLSGVDTARSGSLLLNHKTFMSVGHDEYWSGSQRANVEAARDAGVNLAFFSGNEVFWKTRWEPSIDASQTANRTLVSYKETHANAVIDPADPPTWTGTWRDPRFSPPADGGRPENALTGQIFMANCCTNATIAVPGTYRQLRFWRNTRVASLAAGGSTSLTAGMLNYEWDSDLDNGSRPAGLMDMSATTVTGQSVLQDYGSTYSSGTAVHNLTLYRAPSGALVFGAGTVQWSWGLDSTHDRGSAAADTAVQQATVNLFADMGVQPGSLMAGLVAATQTTDTTAPTTTITAPTAGADLALNTNTTISGTAADTGGGVVAGVEVSVDNGASWHPASGTTSWTYTWRPTTAGSYTIKTRAVDDSGRLQTPGAGVTVTAGGGGGGGGGGNATCPCSIWSSSATPGTVSDPDTAAIEVGVKFQTAQAGFITGIRFYKGSTNTGTHVGHLWSASGTSLATVTFTGETASGWQQANFATPVAVAANTTYVASYYAPVGRYSVDENYFTNATTNAPLTALANGTSPNGVYLYGTGGGFPTSSFAASNYWVDVVLSTTDTTAPTVTARTPASGATNVATTTTTTATFSEAVQASTITMSLTGPNNSAVAGSTSYDATAQKATFTPSAALATGTTYTVNLSGAKDAAGNTMTAVSWSFTTAAADTTAPTITARTPASGAPGVANTAPVTATFSEAVQPATIAVTLTGPNNTAISGTQTYDATAQKVTFNPSAALAASTSYTAQVSGAQDSSGNTMTADSWSFTTAAADTTAPTVTARTPTAGATNVATSASVTATFSEAVQASTITMTLTGPNNTAVAGTQTYDATTLQSTLKPNSALA